jgi:periplasmic protein TonB
VRRAIVRVGRFLGEDTRMSTTAVEARGPNKALFRTAALAGSALIWGSLGYLALTYVPKFEKPPADTDVTIIGVPPRPIVVPPPPPIDPIVKNTPTVRTPAPPNTTPTITTRDVKTDTANPLPRELPAGPPPSTPATWGEEPMGPPIIAIPVPDVIVPPTAIELPPVVIAPPVPQLVINPVRLTGANPTFPNRPLDAGISGEVTLTFTVTPSGRVEDINVTGETPRGYGFANAAREAIRNWTFKPQTIDNVPVAYPARYTISFKLED